MYYKLMVCDFDGTLANTRKAVLISMRDTLYDLTDQGGEIDESAIEGVVATGLNLFNTLQLLLSQLGELTQSRLAEAVRLYRSRYSHEGLRWTTLYPGVRNCLDFARLKGVRMAVVSNKGEVALHRALEQLGITGCFDLIVGEQSDLPPKPAPDVFKKRIRPKFGEVNVKEILFVGDTPPDLEFARNSGIDCCWAAYGHGDPETCRALSPRFEIGDFHELVAILESGYQQANRVRGPGDSAGASEGCGTA